VGTVTCRQFPNLTFAPRKTQQNQLLATSRFTAIMPQQKSLYTRKSANATIFLKNFCAKLN